MIKAIETVYNGYRFRSRLEARWAVFFDKLGIKYEYEPEGYDLDGKRYLPDFRLPDLKCFIEVKGQKPTEDEIKKIELLSEHTLESVHIFYGEIEVPGPGHFYEKVISQMVTWPVSGGAPFSNLLENETGWAQCPWCLSFDIAYHSNIYHLPCECYKYVSAFLNQDPLRKLLVHCPDLAAKEPRQGFKMPGFYDMAITRWWRDKVNMLVYGGDSPRLIAAYTAARQARFEHGEKPL